MEELLKWMEIIDGKTIRSNKQKGKSLSILYRHGVVRVDTAWARKQWRKKGMKSQQFQK